LRTPGPRLVAAAVYLCHPAMEEVVPVRVQTDMPVAQGRSHSSGEKDLDELRVAWSPAA